MVKSYNYLQFQKEAATCLLDGISILIVNNAMIMMV